MEASWFFLGRLICRQTHLPDLHRFAKNTLALICLRPATRLSSTAETTADYFARFRDPDRGKGLFRFAIIARSDRFAFLKISTRTWVIIKGAHFQAANLTGNPAHHLQLISSCFVTLIWIKAVNRTSISSLKFVLTLKSPINQTDRQKTLQ